MKPFLTLIIILFQTSFFAQDKSLGLVLYGHKQSMGLGAPVGIDYNAALTFNRNMSSYVFAKDSLEGNHINEFVTSRNGDYISIATKSTNKKGFIYLFNKNQNIAKSRDLGYMYVKENIPSINWNISKETKTIGNFICSKATAHFRGREYTAWFTNAIPLPFGPWKLQGLPGLILEAYDTHKEVYFYFKSIKYPYNKTAFIEEPNPDSENKNWITFEDFKKEIINRFKKSIENGRLMTEQSGLSIIDRPKSLMRNSYLEVFDE